LTGLVPVMSREHVADLAGVPVGRAYPVAVMGVINVSPESFHAGSVRRDADVLATALAMVEAGAALIDVGARSTAPYLATEITPSEEASRLGRAIERLAAKLPVPISSERQSKILATTSASRSQGAKNSAKRVSASPCDTNWRVPWPDGHSSRSK